MANVDRLGRSYPEGDEESQLACLDQVFRQDDEILDEMTLFRHHVGVDLTSPLRSIAPSLDSTVLEVLAGTESALSASTIARLAPRGSRAGQWPVLNRLVEHGLVLAEPANLGFLYRFNRSHVLAPAVLSAVAARSEILGRLTGAVAALVPEPLHASVFGSFARREAAQDSDIDLLLIVPDEADPYNPAWLDQVHALADSVRAWTGNQLGPLVHTRARLRELAADGEPIVGSWLEEAVLVHGHPLAELMAVADTGAITGRRDRRAARASHG